MDKNIPNPLLFRVAIVAALAVVFGSGMAALQQPPISAKWITAWGASQNGLGMNSVTNATVRLIARVTLSGEAVRVRLDNTFGTSPLVIGKAYVGVRIQGATLATDSNRQAFFNKSASVTVPPAGSVESDPVPMKVLAQQDVAVSLYIPEANVRPSQHGVVQDPENPDLIYPPFNCGDGIHPAPRGYYEMGQAVRLDLFK